MPIPSMVRTSENSATFFIFTAQERVTFPLSRTVHAPQTPLPQPIFVPVRPILRRTTARLSFSFSYSTKRCAPLMMRAMRESFFPILNTSPVIMMSNVFGSVLLYAFQRLPRLGANSPLRLAFPAAA